MSHMPHPHANGLLPTPSLTIQRRARGFLALFFVLCGVITIKQFIPGLLWGGIFAIAIWPLYKKTEKRFGRSISFPIIFSTLMGLVFLVPVILIAFKTIDEIQEAYHWLDTIRHTGLPLPVWVDKLPFAAKQVHNWWNNNLARPDYINDLLHSIDPSHGMQMTRILGYQVKGATHRLILLAFSLLTLFFLLRDGDAIISQSLRGSHRLFGPQGEILARQIVSSVNGTLAGLVLVGLGEGLIMGIVYIFANAPQPLLFGMATAIAAMIPVLGWIVIGFIGLLVLAQGFTISAFVIWIIGAIVLFVADHAIRPVLIGGSTKMPFLWVLLGILGGVETWSLLGLFLGPAIMASLHLLWNHWTSDTGTKPAKYEE